MENFILYSLAIIFLSLRQPEITSFLYPLDRETQNYLEWSRPSVCVLYHCICSTLLIA